MEEDNNNQDLEYIEENQGDDEDEFMFIYRWVDTINLSRPKKNISRDFSDGVLVAEIFKSYYPKLVEIHNYPAAHSVNQKKYNWNTLTQKVFKKLNFNCKKNEIDDVINCKPMAIQHFLKKIYFLVGFFLLFLL